jgi:hypothetical protein
LLLTAHHHFYHHRHRHQHHNHCPQPPLLPQSLRTTTITTTTTNTNITAHQGAVDKVKDCTHGCLYNVFDDPTESVDLAFSLTDVRWR